MSAPTYRREAVALHAAYQRALGWCIQYGIPTYGPGGSELSLGELEAAIRAHRVAHGITNPT